MINIKQLSLMKHAIGFSIDEVKNKKYKAYRNYFTTSVQDDDWEYLCDNKYAEGSRFSYGCGTDPMLYSVSREGLDYLEEVFGIKIEEID